MPTETYTVSVSHDDTSYDEYHSECYNEGATVDVIDGKIDPDRYGGVRFRAVAVPQGVTIAEAHLRLRGAVTDATDTATLRITGDDSDSAAIFEAPNCNPNARSKTTAHTDWVLGSVTQNTWYEPDATAIVQEIVRRTGWAGGNNMAFCLAHLGGGREETYFWSLEGGSPAQLVVTYYPNPEGYCC